MAVRAISKASEAYKRDKSIKPVFDSNGAVIYDQRIMSWKGLDRVSLLTLGGRIKLPVKICDYHAPRMDRIRGQADLIFRSGEFYLCVVVEVPEPKKTMPISVIGVDLGVKNIALDSMGQIFSSEKIEKTRTKLDNLKADLQSCGTDSAKRHSEAPHGQVATCPLAHVHPEKSIKKMFETWGFYGTSRLLSLGNITASRMFSRFSMVITSLDSPRPHPLWEGMPYLKAFR